MDLYPLGETAVVDWQERHVVGFAVFAKCARAHLASAKEIGRLPDSTEAQRTCSLRVKIDVGRAPEETVAAILTLSLTDTAKMVRAGPATSRHLQVGRQESERSLQHRDGRKEAWRHLFNADAFEVIGRRAEVA